MGNEQFNVDNESDIFDNSVNYEEAPNNKHGDHNDMHDSVETAPNDCVDYLIDNMELTLSCEVGSIKLSINDLLNFKTGGLLDYISDLQNIKLKLNSVTIGYGQLVEVDERYGIKITKILNILDSIQHN